MEYILNEIPVKTTNNFNINDLKINLSLPKTYEFKKYISNIDIEYSEIKNFNTKIGLEFKKALNIDITIKDKIDDLIELTYEFTNNDVLINNINITYLENSSADIILRYVSKDLNPHFNYIKQNIKMNKYSIGNITVINNLNDSSYNFIASESIVLDNSNLNQNLIDISSNIKVYNYYSNVLNYAKSTLNNIYIGLKENILDMNYNYINTGIKSVTNIESVGVLNDSASKKFRGTIDFISGSSNSIGKVLESVILLSDTCKSSSVPILLCGEENVEGAHSISTGKIDLDKLFYLMSRGMNKKEASITIILGNFNKIINNINNIKVKEELIKIIENKI